MSFRVGVDVGGTFTDFLVSGAGKTARVYKSSTTPDDPTIGFFDGPRAGCTGRGTDARRVPEAGRHDRARHDDHDQRRADEHRRADRLPHDPGIPGRAQHASRAQGAAVREVQPARAAGAPPSRAGGRGALQPRGPGADAAQRSRRACRGETVPRGEGRGGGRLLFWSFRNPAHELRTREILEEELPGVYVSLSTEILPQIRLYERHSTTALNAYSGPILTRYLSRLQRELEDRGYRGRLLIMQSNGGVMSPQVAFRQRFVRRTRCSPAPRAAPARACSTAPRTASRT